MFRFTDFDTGRRSGWNSRAGFASERGGALVELAVVLPVLLFVLWGALYLTELGLLRLRAQEISHYATWGFAGQPLSDFGGSFRHRRMWEQARERVVRDVAWVYSSDLDGRYGSTRFTRDGGVTGGRGGLLLRSTLEPLGRRDIRDAAAPVVPGFASVSWAEPLSTVGVVLSALGLGTGTASLVRGIWDRFQMNTRGLVTGGVRLRVGSPVRPGARRRVAAMDTLLDMGAPTSGFVIRDVDRGPMRGALVADPWKVEHGYAVGPKVRDDDLRPMAHGVAALSERSLTAWPLGALGELAMQLLGFSQRLPAGLAVVLGVPPEDPQAHVMSRPYSARRQGREVRGSLQAGQVDLWSETGAAVQESGAVRHFETGPLYDDPRALEQSGYHQALQRRGPNYMGCPQSQKRGCWE